jgi:hypothetical protein
VVGRHCAVRCCLLGLWLARDRPRCVALAWEVDVREPGGKGRGQAETGSGCCGIGCKSLMVGVCATVSVPLYEESHVRKPYILISLASFVARVRTKQMPITFRHPSPVLFFS